MNRIKMVLVATLATVFCGLLSGSAGASGRMTESWAETMVSVRPSVPEKVLSSGGILRSNAGSFDEAAKIAAQNVPFAIPSDCVWTQCVGSAREDLFRCQWVLSDGTRHLFAVYGQYGNPVPYFWTGEGYSAHQFDSEQSALTALTNFVRQTVCGGSASPTFKWASSVLDASAVKICEDGQEVAIPYARFRLVFVDDIPGANWQHPCRYVFVAEDLSSFAVSYRHTPPRITRRADGSRIFLKRPAGGSVISLEAVKNAVYAKANDFASNALTYTGDASHSYFVLISGGADPEYNGIRFWADTAMFYSTLTKKYGVAKSHIHVFMSDGTSSDRDANLSDEDDPVLVSSPLDLDGDGSSDIEGPAMKSKIKAAFTSLANSLGSNDRLCVFVTSHGGPVGTGGSSNWDCKAYLYSSTGATFDSEGNYTYFTDTVMTDWTKNINCPVVFMIETCYSGGFIDNLKASATSTKKRAIATACNHYESSYGTGGGGVWGGGIAGKTPAYNCWMVQMTAAFRGYMPKSAGASGYYPWNDGSSVNADSNSDGQVSLLEAKTYAAANDAARCKRSTHSSSLCSLEHPQFGESPSGTASAYYLFDKTAPSTYTVTYCPGSSSSGSTYTATKTANVNLKLRGETYSRSGYKQIGWSKTDGGSKAYALYEAYTLDASVTLYPVWQAVVTFSTAVDNTTLTFTTGGDSPWFGQTSTSSDGVDAARSGLIDDNQSSWFQTTVSGAGTISFRWYVSSEVKYDFLELLVDDSVVKSVSGQTNSWTAVSQSVTGTGSHTIKWRYRKDVSNARGLDAAFVDQIVWTPVPPAYTVTYRPGQYGSGTSFTATKTSNVTLVLAGDVFTRSGYRQTGWSTTDGGSRSYTLRQNYYSNASIVLYPYWTPVVSTATALDNTSLSFSTPGTKSWFGQSQVTHDGVDAMRSGPQPNLSTNTLTTTVSGSGTISFWWYVSSEAKYDVLDFVVDGKVIKEISGTTNSWTQVSHRIATSGSHQLAWRYRNDVSLRQGLDAGFVDQVVWMEDTDPEGLPDLGFALFGDWEYPLYTSTNSTGRHVRLFNKGGSVALVYGFANFSETAAVGSFSNLVEVYSYEGNRVYSDRDRFSSVNLGQYRGYSMSRTATALNNLAVGVYYAQVTLDVDDAIEEEEEDDVATFRFAVRDPVTLATALDNSTLSFAVSGTEDWYGTAGLGADGTDCAASKHIGHSMTNRLQTTVSGRGTISFKWKVSSEADCDELEFLIDGVVMKSISGEGGGWASCSYAIDTVGSHTLQWRYVKDSSMSSGGDCGWIDQVVWNSRPDATYTVTYRPGANAQGGTVQTATKTAGESLTLASALYTRAGYQQTGWALADGGAKVYDLGGIYATDADIALYPSWTPAGTNPEPPWTVVPYADLMPMYVRVYDSQARAYLEGTDAKVGVFSASGECRGVGKIIQGPQFSLFQLSVSVASASEAGLTLRYWDSEHGELEATPSFAATSSIGTFSSPRVFTVGQASFDLTLVEGWNWISLPLEAEDPSLSALFGSLQFSDNDVVMTASGMATYFSGSWYPAGFELEPGVTYRVHKSAGGSEQMSYTGSEPSSSLTVVSGWNWMGVPLTSPVNLSDLTHSGGFSDNDVIMGVSEMATYSGGRWYGGTFTQLRPGVGYRAKFALAGTVAFVAAQNAVTVPNAQTESNVIVPSWTPVTQSDVMVVYARAYDSSSSSYIDAEGSKIGIFAADGTCRGSAELVEGPSGYLFQVVVGISSTTESGFTAKVWDAATATTQDLLTDSGESTFSCNSAKQIGQFLNPVTMRTKVTLAKSTVSFDPNGGIGATPPVTATNSLPMPTITVKPTRERYTFIGYYDSPSGGTRYYTAALESARNWDKTDVAVTLYAQWEKLPDATLTSVSIVGPAAIVSESSATYTCTAHYSDGSTKQVVPTWSIDGGASFSSITAAGVLTATLPGPNGNNHWATIIKASYTEGGVTKSATEWVFIDDITTAVSFDANGGSGGPSSVLQTNGVAMVKLSISQKPTRAQYAFAGYFDAAVGGTQYYTDTLTSARNWDKKDAAVTLYAHWTVASNPIVRPAVVPGCEGMGAVSGGGKTVKSGDKVSLKAAAKKGYVFAGWYQDATYETPAVGAEDYRSPSFTAFAGDDEVTLYALFMPTEEDYAEIYCWDAEDGYLLDEEIAPISISVDSGSLPTVTIKGLPPGLKFTAKNIYEKGSTSEIEYAANTIYGTPTKSGIYTVTISVKTAGKATATETLKLIVRDNDEVLIDAEYDSDCGKVTGTGICADGKTLTLKATASKGFVFAGWFYDDEFELPVDDKGVDYRSTSLPVGGDHFDMTYYAWFIDAECDTDIEAYVEEEYEINGAWELPLEIFSFSLPSVTASGLPAGLKLNAKTLTIEGTPTKPGVYTVTLSLKNATVKKALTQTFVIKVANIESPYLGVDYATDAYVYHGGVAVGWNLGDYATDGYSVSGVSGLPAGLKFDTKTGMIEGVPTKTGAYTVTVSLKNGSLKSTATVTLNVEAIDTWAYGTFNGGSTDGQVQLAISSAGKISGKYAADGLTYTLSAASFDSWDSGAYVAKVTASYSVKNGIKTVKKSEQWTVEIYEGNVGGELYCISADDEWKFEAYQNLWSQKDWKALGTSLFGKRGTTLTFTGEEYGLGDGEKLTLLIRSNGAVTIKGKFSVCRSGVPYSHTATASSVVCVKSVDPFEGFAYVYFPVNENKGFDGYTFILPVSVE